MAKEIAKIEPVGIQRSEINQLTKMSDDELDRHIRKLESQRYRPWNRNLYVYPDGYMEAVEHRRQRRQLADAEHRLALAKAERDVAAMEASRNFEKLRGHNLEYARGEQTHMIINKGESGF